MRPVVIFDIDGTLANIQHRQHLSKNKSWNEFFDTMGEDEPVAAMVSLFKTLYNSQEYEMHIFTGRPDNYRKITEQWLFWNNIPEAPLHMRQFADNRADNVIKEEMLDQLLSQNKHVLFVVDDRNQVVEMWRRRGIICLQCADGDF